MSPSEAAERMASGAVVLDARSLRQTGLRRLRGATRFAWTHTRQGGARSGRLAPPEGVAARLQASGVSWGHPVLVVGAGEGGWGEGARVAWTLDWLAHPDVSWCPLSGTWPRWPPGTTLRSPLPWSGRTRAALRPPVGWTPPGSGTVIDVRTAAEFGGKRLYGEARGGHIPGARHIPLAELWSARRLEGGLADRLRVAGVGPEDAVVTVCTGGVRSAAAALLIAAGGHRGPVLHDEGGMWAWSEDPSRPMQP